MQCVEFEARLQRVLDERGLPEADERLSAHARKCPQCESMLRTQEYLFAALKLPLSEGVSTDLGHRVLDELPRIRRRSKQRTLIAVVLATAAALFIAVLPFRGSLHDTARSGPENGRGLRGLPAVAHLPVERPVASLTEEEEAEFRQMIRDLMTQIPYRQLQALEPVDQLAGSIRPLAATFGAAFDAIWRALPGARQQTDELPQARFAPVDRAHVG